MAEGKLPFVGRQDALDAFHSLLSVRAQTNALYVQAGGGLGKTRLLKVLVEDCRRPRWHVLSSGSDIDPLIDFFELQNRSVAGLRRSIIVRLGESYFSDFLASEAEQRAAEAQAEGTEADSRATSTVVALRRRSDDLFFSVRAAAPYVQAIVSYTNLC